MSDFQTQMNRVVAEFVAQITELAKTAAIETLQTVLGNQTRRPRPRPWPRREAHARRARPARRAVPGVREGEPRPPDRADQQAARDDHEGSRAADPQAPRGGRDPRQGPEALDDVLRRWRRR